MYVGAQLAEAEISKTGSVLSKPGTPGGVTCVLGSSVWCAGFLSNVAFILVSIVYIRYI